MTGPGLLLWLGALSGLGLAAGVLVVLRGLPVRAQPRLADRIAPYLAGWQGPSIRGPRMGLHPVLQAAGAVLGRVLGSETATARRLQQAGGTLTLEDLRAQQVLWAVAGTAAGSALGALLVVTRGAGVSAIVGLTLLGAVGGVWGRDHLLSLAVRRREHRILLQFPTVAELLALSVGAGEGALGALERVSRAATGDLSDELATTLAQVRAGRPLAEALDGLAERTAVAPVARFVDGITVALDRGTPLADVLRAQAEDVREAGRRQLIELGGRKELLMMVPVVFLLLPVTVLFAVFPGIVALGMGAP